MKINLINAVMDTEDACVKLSTGIRDVTELKEYISSIRQVFMQTRKEDMMVHTVVEFLAALELTTYCDCEGQIAFLADLSRKLRMESGRPEDWLRGGSR